MIYIVVPRDQYAGYLEIEFNCPSIIVTAMITKNIAVTARGHPYRNKPSTFDITN
jgi:hypothetical protein